MEDKTRPQRRINADGSTAVRVWCDRCARRATLNVSVSLRAFKPNELAAMEVYADYQAKYGETCSVTGCGRTDTQLNHWFPRCLDYELAERFPKSYLCRYHHDVWHRMVTPWMFEHEVPGL